ncbi:hypothetical protein O4220_27445 [Rhodococcus ruber]|uniref:DUF3263 domain-containing protein n=1 Tax=Rhodococcus ruber TaxID=1830 RepID=A0ABT4MN61_9NOCA|nr:MULTISPECIES: hypothetical protein [Rhodococcus]MCZ4522273.1 hypothetical protein [Rhodococcus ruber]MDI9933776.1 hypothetical protein [Rhodococcus sp. IEGM 1354]
MVSEQSSDPLVAFAVVWEPFGGASASDVFVEFGLGMGEYRRRLREQLNGSAGDCVEPAVRHRLVEYSRRPAKPESRVGE